MMSRFLYKSMLAVLGIFACVESALSSPNGMTVYESQDKSTVLISDGMYFYLGTKDHPTQENFLRRNGERVILSQSGNHKCVGLGIFQFARFEEGPVVCGDKEINIVSKNYHKKTVYRVQCSEFVKDVCVHNAGRRPALEYRYEIRHGFGITRIYLSGVKDQNRNNILIYRSGPPFLKPFDF